MSAKGPYKSRIAAGLCGRCGGQSRTGKTHCAKCADSISASNRIRKRERIAAGICVCCGEKRDSKRFYCSRCRARHSELGRQAKKELFEAYGGAFCACCGEARLAFLSIDHINGGGGKERMKNRTSKARFWLKKQGYPPGYRVLCFNCNSGRQVNGGICPHEEERRLLCR